MSSKTAAPSIHWRPQTTTAFCVLLYQPRVRLPVWASIRVGIAGRPGETRLPTVVTAPYEATAVDIGRAGHLLRMTPRRSHNGRITERSRGRSSRRDSILFTK
jgi:hypothetical protein